MNGASRSTADEAQGARFSLAPIMFETFVCSMGMMAFVALAGPIARQIGLAPWQIGAAMTVAGIAWMIMARVWGVASDQYGRRRIILIGLAGFALSYVLLCLFIDWTLRFPVTPLIAFVGLLLGRGIAGVFYAAVPATGAALIADHIAPEGRAAAMAAIGASSAAGMVVGPGFAGLIGPYSLSIPLYITAVLPAIALLVLWRVLPRDEPRPDAIRHVPTLYDTRLMRPMSVAFVAMFSVAIAQITVGFLALDKLGLDGSGAARAAGIALALVGVSLVCAQVVLRKLNWPPARLIRFGCVIGAFGFASVFLVQSTMVLWISFCIAAFGMGWVYPSVSALAANSVGPGEQGAAAGSVAAAQGLGVILGPLVGTAVYVVEPAAPYLLVSAMLVLAALWPTRAVAVDPDHMRGLQ